MKKILTADRRHQLTAMLIQDGSIKVGETAKHFGVSTETIRKDIIYLESQGVAEKSHGGAIASSAFLERPVSVKEMENIDSKSAIAAKALDFIPEGGVIIMDAGSTNYALAKQLTQKQGLTIFSNSIAILNLLASSDNTLISFGGIVRKSSLAMVGNWSNWALQSIQADVAFMGSDGFMNFSGPSSTSYDEAEFKRNIVAASRDAVILADSSKFTSTGLFNVCHWSEIKTFITDSAAPRESVTQIQKHTAVICV